MLRHIYNIVSTLISFAIAFGITYLDSKYFLAGVEAERGYEALGGEVIFLFVIFACVYYAAKNVIAKLTESIIDDVAEFDIN